MRTMACTAVALVAGALAGFAPASPGGLTGDLTPTHDPVLIREGDTYYVFSTGTAGRGPLAVRTSRDLVHWAAGSSPVERLPEWVSRTVPGARGMWAPDVARVGGRYRLYYAVSTFGSQRSAIGLMSSATLDPNAPGYGWRDEGPVVASTEHDDFNAIDPSLVIDREGGQWLALGSFWGGLKLFALDRATGKLLGPSEAPITLAHRPTPPGGADAIEAPLIVDHGGWYWLVASFDYCCRGAASTYYTVVGRSKAVTGPYRDRDGRSMLDGGGTVLLQADAAGADRFRGPGHAGFTHDRDGRDYLVYHAYDRLNRGAPTLRISPIRWGADGWPAIEP